MHPSWRTLYTYLYERAAPTPLAPRPTPQGPDECVAPLGRLRPEAASLGAAMSPALDTYFAALPKFRWAAGGRVRQWCHKHTRCLATPQTE
jgi:hypothetical protein